MAVQNFAGGLDQIVMIPLPSLSIVAPTAPQTGYEVPINDNYDVSIRQSFELFGTLNTTGSPDEQLEGTESVNGPLDWYITWNTAPLLFAQLIGGTVTTGAGPDYVHTNTLGDQVNKIGEAFALEHHQLQADPATQYMLVFGGRISTSTLTVSANGGVVFNTQVEALREALPSTTAVADTIIEVTDSPISAKLATLTIDTVDSPCKVVEFTMQIDHQLDTDTYALFSGTSGEGDRCTLTRGNPTVTGTFNVFFNDETYAYITAARSVPKTTFDFVIRYEESATKYLEITISNAALALQGHAIQGSAGYNCKFTYVASGDDAVIAETGNEQISYPA